MGKARDLLVKLGIERNLLSRVDRIEGKVGGTSLPTSRPWSGSLPGSSPFDLSNTSNPLGLFPDIVGGGGVMPSPLPLSTISPDMGLLLMGEFRTGNLIEPGEGFSGVRMGYPGFTYGGSDWNIVGVSNDVLQFGLRSSDGTALAGAGAVTLNASGIVLDATFGVNTSASIEWFDGVTRYFSVGTTSSAGVPLSSYLFSYNVPLNLGIGNTSYFTMTTSGYVGFNISNPLNVIHIMQSGGSAYFSSETYTSVSAGDAGGFQVCRARGTSAVPAYLNDGDRIGTIYFKSWDNTKTTILAEVGNAGEIAMFSDGASSSGAQPGLMHFSTTPAGSSTTIRRMLISSSGEVTCILASSNEIIKVQVFG